MSPNKVTYIKVKENPFVRFYRFFFPKEGWAKEFKRGYHMSYDKMKAQKLATIKELKTKEAKPSFTTRLVLPLFKFGQTIRHIVDPKHTMKFKEKKEIAKSEQLSISEGTTKE